MHKVGFSKSYLRWVTSYLTERKQFVQIDDKLSSTIEAFFGVPQGSILGPVIFNLYVNDLSAHQYADDTTIYAHNKPANIKQWEDQLQHALDQLSTWSSGCNLCLNPDKTKVMLFSTQQLARVHKLDEYPINLHTNGAKLERIKATRLLHRNWWKPEIERWLSIQNIKVLQYSCCYQETQESCSFPCQETSGREPCVVINRLQRYSTWHRDFNMSNLPRQVLFTITMRICQMLWNPDGSQLVIVETIT